VNATDVDIVQNIGLDVSIQFGATLMGALIGFGLALWSDRKKKREAKQEKINHMIKSITEELQEIMQVPTEKKVKFSELMDWNKQKRLFEGKFFSMTTPAFESAVNSGDFILLSTELQSKISGVYSRIYDCQRDMDNISNFYTTPIFPTAMAENVAMNLRKNLRTRLDELKTECNDFWSYFESIKSELNLKSTERKHDKQST